MTPVVFAHRTGMARAPENSMEGFLRCVDDGAVAAECDVTFVDGAGFIWLKEMRDSSARPSAASANARTDCQESVLRIDDVFRFLRSTSRFRVYFDVKYYANDILGHFVPVSKQIVEIAMSKIVRPAVAEGLASRIGLVTFLGGFELLRAAKNIHGDIWTDLMVIFPWTRITESRSQCLDAVTIGWSRFNHWRMFGESLARIVATARDQSLHVRGGLANTQEDVRWLLERRYGGVWTDNVPMAHAAINRWHLEHPPL